MDDTDVVHHYAKLGLNTFVAEEAREFELEKGRPPRSILLGMLEWVVILEHELTDDFEIGGITVIPDSNLHSGVRFT